MWNIIDVATGTHIASLLKRPLGDTWWPVTDGIHWKILRIDGNNVFVEKCPDCVVMSFEDAREKIRKAHNEGRSVSG